MIIPYGVDVPMRRVPVANWLLILGTCVVSLAVWLSPRPAVTIRVPGNLDTVIVQMQGETIPALALQPGKFAITQLFTHVLVHGDVVHLLGNMLFLFVFGNAVNAKVGHAVYLFCYFLLGAMGGVAWMMFGEGLPMVGASGAISGIIGMFLVFFPRNDIRILLFWEFAWQVFSLSSIWVVCFYMLWDLIGTLFLAGSGIAYVTHLAGGCLGIGVGMIMALSIFGPEPYERSLPQMLGWQEREDDDMTLRLRLRGRLK